MVSKTLSFAKECYETNKDEYKKRNQKNPKTIIRQIKVGKIGELFDVRWAKKYMGFDVLKEVDFKIYPAHKKDFSSDLIFGGEAAKEYKDFSSDLIFCGAAAKEYFGIDKDEIKASCKTSFLRCDSDFTEYADGSRIPVMLQPQHSWVYQLQNNDGQTGKDKVKHDIYMFNIVDEEDMTVELFAWVQADIVKRMFIKPYKESLKENKLVVQQVTCGRTEMFPDGMRLREFPCGISELLDEKYEPEESV